MPVVDLEMPYTMCYDDEHASPTPTTSEEPLNPMSSITAENSENIPPTECDGCGRSTMKEQSAISSIPASSRLPDGKCQFLPIRFPTGSIQF